MAHGHLIDIIGKAQLSSFAPHLEQILRQDQSLDTQYAGLLALSLLGAQQQLTDICTNPHYQQVLSYRNLLEILTAYTGDKATLYGALLSSPDPYIVRVCTKQIGVERIEELAPRLLANLQSDDFSLQLDTLRTLGQLHYLAAGPAILPFLGHARWEMCSVAVTALAAIDLATYAPDIEAALHDSEWQVRYNAAQALCQLPERDDILERIAASGDRYATEILSYMIEINDGKGEPT